MNWLDWVILAIVLVSTAAALGRGIVVELLSLLGMVMGLVLAGKYYTEVSPHLLIWLKVPALADMAAFLLIVVVTLLLMTWLGHALHDVAKYSGMGWLDSLLGAVFGLVRGLLAVAVALMALAAFWPLTSWTSHSTLAPYFMDATSKLAMITPPGLHDKIDNGIWTLKQLSNHHGWR